jgi:hypothetical protein
MFAFPFSARVEGVSGRPHPLICLARTCLGSLGEDWAVSSSISTVSGDASRPLRSITTGGRDGWLSEASGIARLASITLCDYVGVSGKFTVAFACM